MKTSATTFVAPDNQAHSRRMMSQNYNLQSNAAVNCRDAIHRVRVIIMIFSKLLH